MLLWIYRLQKCGTVLRHTKCLAFEKISSVFPLFETKTTIQLKQAWVKGAPLWVEDPHGRNWFYVIEEVLGGGGLRADTI